MLHVFLGYGIKYQVFECQADAKVLSVGIRNWESDNLGQGIGYPYRYRK